MPRSRKDWTLLAGTGILTFGVSYGLVFWGEQYISSGLTAVLFTTFPFFGMVFAHLALPSEPMTPRRMAGAVLGIAGVAVIFADQLGLSGARAGLGSLAIVLAAISGALSGVLLKKHGNHLDPAVVTVTQMAIGGLPMVFLGLALEGNPFRLDWSPKAVFCLLYLALVGTSLAFVLWYKLLQASRVTRVQMMPLANTVVAVGMGWLILGEKYGLRGVAGGAAVLAGLALALATKVHAPSVSEAPR